MPAHNFKDLTGQTFGRLTAISRAKNKQNRVAWKCICECGMETIVRSDCLSLGNTKSCGCLDLDMLLARSTTHGLAGSTEYNSWSKMKTRCYKNNHIYFVNYGGRGIKVCARWINSFENFFADMGFKPSPNHSIDRINNDGNYEPANCRWATRIEQANNRRPKSKHPSN